MYHLRSEQLVVFLVFLLYEISLFRPKLNYPDTRVSETNKDAQVIISSIGESARTSISGILQSLSLKPFLASNTLTKLHKVHFI